MELTTIVQILCLTFATPSFHLNKDRQKTACQSIEHVYNESKKNNISPTLLLALIYIESGWKKTAVSWAGACGLTQVIPKYTGGRNTKTKKYTCKQLKNPRIAITAGAKILNYWINKHAKGNIKVGLCGYSSGYRCKGKKPLKRGMSYARKVLKVQRKIKRTMKGYN